MEKWISLMRRLGSEDEQKIYAEMTPSSLVERLLSCRPLAFLTGVDSWLAKDGRHGAQNWDETARSQLDTFLSYDEIKISALLQASTPTLLINSGSRDNVGRLGFVEGSRRQRPEECIDLLSCITAAGPDGSEARW